MDGQISIFDYLGRLEIESKTEKEIALEIGEKTNLKFEWDDLVDGYMAYKGKIQFYVAIETYTTSGIKFIGVGWNTATVGGASPCNSIDEATNYLLKVLEKQKKKKIT